MGPLRRGQVRWSIVRDAFFLVGLVVIFVLQLVEGLAIIANADDADAVDTIAILVIVCFLGGIGRSWELIGGPSFGIGHEVTALVRGQQNEPADEDKTA
jgi:hypothetical protein